MWNCELFASLSKIQLMKYLSFCLALLFSMSAFADNNPDVIGKAKLQHVTVYQQAANLYWTASVPVKAGTSLVHIEGLPSSINIATLQSGSKDVVIQSTNFLNNIYRLQAQSARLKIINDSINLINELINKNAVEQGVVNNLLTILNSNLTVTGANTGLNVTELMKLIDYNSTKQRSLNAELGILGKESTKLQETLGRLGAEQTTENAKTAVPNGEVVMQITSATATTANFQVNFVVSNAGWTPIYDIRAENLNDAVKLNYKAQVWQNTGMPWNDVKLTISTGNINQSGTQPVLSPWWINFNAPNVYKRKNDARADYYAPVANGASINLSMSTAPGVTQFDLKDKSVAWSNSLGESVTVSDNALNVEFDIALSYDIPSDGQVHLVNMIDYTLNASFEHYSVPKLEGAAFLLARISDWEKLNLIPGTANIFFEGNYVGQSTIDPNITGDTLNCSLGRDKKVVVKRNKLKDQTSSKLIGGEKTQTYTYEIVLRNLRKEPIVVHVFDQYPLSQDKEIIVDPNSSGSPLKNEERGEWHWKLNIGNGDSKQLKVGYTVRYPKEKQVYNLH